MAEEPDDARTFGGLLRALRIAAGFTQEQLAESSGLGVRTIRDLERGRVRRPHRESIELLATALGLSPEARDDLARAGLRPPVRPEPIAASAVGAGEPVPRQLPPAVRHFAGRGDELKILTNLIDTAATAGGTVVISAIDGTAGIGKTALAVHWAHQVADQFPGGQLYVNLRGFDPGGPPLAPAEAIRGFLDALGVPPRRSRPAWRRRPPCTASLLAGRRVLVRAGQRPRRRAGPAPAARLAWLPGRGDQPQPAAQPGGRRGRPSPDP